jgi:16S rRNA (adenine1518-N6/adenine1519-N6)-dimethyltransferase
MGGAVAGGLTPEMRAELSALGFRPSRRLGQNFMRDGNMIAALAREAGVGKGDLVLEPGPGAGALTTELLERGCEVLAVELDPVLCAFLRERFAGEQNLDLFEGDVLGAGRALNPRVAEKLSGRTFLLAANLPYSAATPFLLALAVSGLPWRGGAVTVQKEAAERLAAEAGQSSYGAASVLLAVGAGCELVRSVPPDVFWPRPRVDSAILRLDPRAHPLVPPPEVGGFAAFVKAVFSARRKKLVRALRPAGLTAGAARAAAQRAGVSPEVRPGELSPQELVRLWRTCA